MALDMLLSFSELKSGRLYAPNLLSIGLLLSA